MNLLLDFIKMTGAGNDFILFDNRKGLYNAVSWDRLAPEICDRHFGVGADGLLVVEAGKDVDFSLKYFNSDGSCGGMCGNGGRCAAYFFMSEKSVPHCNFVSLGYAYSCNRHDDLNISIKMKSVSIDNIKYNIDIYNNQIPIYFIDTGAPHAVIFIDDLPADSKQSILESGIAELGRIIRNHTMFHPDGTNVDFITIIDDHMVSMRTYERGVEAETLACGTGAVASACVEYLVNDFPPPIRIHTRSNHILTVNFKVEGTLIKDVVLIGPAEKVFVGSYEFEIIGR